MEKPIERAKEVIRQQAGQILKLSDRLGEDFTRALDILESCTGRVILTGMGKSGIVARKLTATLNSTGTPAMFLHPSEGIHGDLGVVTSDDVVIILSKSGDTDELSLLMPPFKRLGVPIIGIVGKLDSPLASKCDVVLDASVESEADAFDLVPTTSATAALVLGDALAVVLLELRGFSPEDFAIRHPGGALGRRLLLRVSDLMHAGDEMPSVSVNSSVKEAIFVITSKRLGVTLVLDEHSKLAGIYTDGDLRRTVEKGNHFLEHRVADHMTKNPKTIDSEALVEQALSVMENHSITSLVVLDSGKSPVGIIHLHDILRRKIV